MRPESNAAQERAERPSAPPLDLTNCDREPIHIPGTILPHGAMLVVDPESFEVLQVAGDTSGLLGRDGAALIGQRGDALFSTAQIDRLRSLCAELPLTRPRHLLDPALRVLPDRAIDASIHRSDGVLLLEFEDAAPNDVHGAEPLASVQDMLDTVDAATATIDACRLAAERVRAVAGYDRVMVYQFQPDATGWVIAEARRDDLTPFLDLHFPASDIPVQARELYLRSWLRLIAEVDYTPAPLTPPLNPRTDSPLDMSFATLRDVSPVDREYLRNMGVAASMSISIVRDGKLWGLIACHHYSPKRLPRHLRAICELFGAMFSLQLDARERAELLEARIASRGVLQDIALDLSRDDDYADGLMRQANRLLDYIDAGGVSLRASGKGGIAIKVNDGVRVFGDAPPPEQVAALTDWLSLHMQDGDGLFLTDRLSELYPPAADFADIASGLLALSVSREPSDFILWFRPEVVATVRWGGDPTKPVEIGPNGDRLTPRKSFDAWSEEVRGRAAPWSAADSEAAFDLRVSLLDIVLRRIDAAARERERAHERERMLMNELDHRVKNTLSNIQALVSHTGRNADTLTNYVEGLEKRIRAMSKAHGLLTETRWTGAEITDLIAKEMDQHSGAAIITLDGPLVMLSSKAALALSLAIHELATNAVKYGALSVTSGEIAIHWKERPEGIQLTWRELGGPPVSVPTRRGFGSTLIERALEIETGGRSTLRFESTGVVCDILLPQAAVVEVLPDRPQPEQLFAPVAAKARTLADKLRILVVEDTALVLMTVEMLIEDLGWTIVGPASRLSDALALAASEPIEAALLDINLDGEMSWPIADLLNARGIPFTFTTGYDGATVLPERLSTAPVLGKPFLVDDVEACLRRMVER